VCNDENATLQNQDIVLSTNIGGTGNTGNTAGGVPLTLYGFRYYLASNVTVGDPPISTLTLCGVYTVNSGLTGPGSVGNTGYGLPIYVNSSITTTSGGNGPVRLNGGISATRIA
jgi:hypothetical protein